MTDEEPKQQRLILVQGQRVGLGALRHDLIPAYLRWRSDPEVMRGTGAASQVPTVEAIQAWYEQATRPGNTEVHFTIYDLDDAAPEAAPAWFDYSTAHGSPASRARCTSA